MRLNAENVADYAETWVRQARAQDAVLDYRLESVEALEALFRLADPQLQSGALPDARRNILVFYNGCYLGEVLTRAFGGVWGFAENWFDAFVLVPAGAGAVQLFPFQKIYRRVEEGPAAHDLVGYVAGLQDCLRGVSGEADPGGTPDFSGDS